VPVKQLSPPFFMDLFFPHIGRKAHGQSVVDCCPAAFAGFLFFILLILGSTAKAQFPLLLRDINVQTDPAGLLTTSAGSDPRFLTVHNGVLYFTAKQTGTTVGLWKSTGKSAGTVKVADLPGTAYGLTGAGNLLYFVADQPNYGLELWKSDGTAASTARIKDIYSGSIGSAPGGLINVNGTLYFVATDAARGSELWKSTGTDAGTVLVKDIIAGSAGSNPQNLTNINGTLYFVANDGINGYELWKSNGTAAGTVLVKDINTGSASSSPQSLTNVNGVLYFTADNGANGYELWKSDGTTNGTVLVKDIWPGSFNSMPHFLTNVNGVLYFSANDGVRGIELWKSTGVAAGTVLVAETQTGSAGGDPRYLKNIKGTLYFSATNGITGQELWKSDGTPTGTVMVKNIRPGGEGSNSNPFMFNDLKGVVYFTANDGTSGRELWKSDGKETGTTPVIELKTGEEGSAINTMISVADTIYFTADDGKKGTEIWKLESCLPLKVPSDTTICHTGPISLPLMVANYSSFVNPIWRKGSFDGPIVTVPTNVNLDSSKTDFYLTAQLSTGCTSTAQLTVRTISLPESVGSIRVLLEGAYRYGIGTMTTKLNEQGLLPGQIPLSPLGSKTPPGQPYSGFPWYYNGNEVINNYESNITDWVLVSLRTDPNDPATTVFKAAAKLQSDGVSVVTGCPSRLREFTNYYVAVEHRNHVGIVSPTPTLFINGGFFYDFSIIQSYIPSNMPAIGQKFAENRYMMYAGDFQKVAAGNEVNANDISVWQRENGFFARYLPSDANMDGEVNALDKILWALNNGLFSGVRF
jgi:ELWxxDGT repeat protein